MVSLPPADAEPPAPSPVDASPPPPAAAAGPEADAGACPSQCFGKATQDLALALQQKAGEARRCYDAALASDPGVEGRVLLAVRVGPDGSVCSSQVIQSGLPGEMNACLERLFAQATFPGPVGGCLDARVPMLFKPVRPDAGP